MWRDAHAHLARSKFTAENFSVARSESGELSRDGHRLSKASVTHAVAAPQMQCGSVRGIMVAAYEKNEHGSAG